MTDREPNPEAATVESSKTALSKDVLKNALAFRGDSLELFSNAVEEVIALTENGDAIYPPHEYPSLREPKKGSTIKKGSDSIFEGRLAPAEAVGVKVLLVESSALMQSFVRSSDKAHKLDEVLGTGSDAWQSDAMDGIVEFAHRLAMATSVRERIMSGQGEPKGKTLEDLALSYWHETFSKPLEKDGLKIGSNTATSAVAEIQRQAKDKIPLNPDGARNEDKIKARIAGKARGAELAKALYLETVDLATNILPADIEPKNVSTSSTITIETSKSS